jgi:PGF-pre-PGF domain-containing protein
MMAELVPLHTTLKRTILILLILAALCASVQAGTGIWTTNGPFATGTGDRVITALVIAPDGTLYAGTGSGSVWSLIPSATQPVATTPTTAPPSSGGGFSIGSYANGGDDSSGSTAGTGGSGTTGVASQAGTGGRQQSGQNQLAPPEGEGTPVNVGGSTPVTSATVYGDGNSGVVVTATPVDGPPAGVSPAPGSNVYSYMEISPAHTGTVTGATLTFTVSQSWLDEHHLTPAQIVMYHYTGGQWVALPTTAVKSSNGQVYFSATTSSFSPFAIGVTEHPAPAVSTTQVPQKTIGSPAAGSTMVQTPAHPAAIPQPIATAAPAPAARDTGFPLATIALIGAGCILLIGSGWYVRRWYIRRQNPALFEEY